MHTLCNDKISILYLLLTLSIFIQANNEHENYVFPYNDRKNCKVNEYFRIDTFSCIECDVKKNLAPAENGLTCVCDKFSRMIGIEYDFPKCERCKPGTFLTSDKKSCIPCGKDDNFTCSCQTNEIKVERDVNSNLLQAIKCVQCSDNSYPSADGLKCIPCNNITKSSHNNCVCPITSHVRIEDYCFKRNEIDLLDIRNTYSVQFSNENIDSYYFRKELRLSAYLCKNKDKAACERLSNMCALTLSDKSAACKLSRSNEGPRSISWMFYESNGYPVIANNRLIPMKYALGKNNANNRLNFTMATFSTDGILKYVNTPDFFCTFLNDVRFGINANKKCRINAKELLSRGVNFFIPYLLYSEKGKLFLSTLPVFTKNKAWQPLKRFFLIDSISSYRAIPNLVDDTFKRDDEISIFRYMKSLELLITVQNDREGGHIYAPLIVIEYGELKKQDVQENKQVTVDYKVIFILTNTSVNNSIEIAIGVLSGFAIMYSALKAWSYCKRNFNGVLNVGVLVWFFIYCLGSVGNVLLLVTSSVCMYTFVFYKGQTVLHTLLPTDNIESKLYLCTIIAFCFKVVDVGALIYRHRNINVFFVDWEQPRTIQGQSRYDSPRTSLKKSYGGRFEEEGPPRTPKGQPPDNPENAGSEAGQQLPVSIWRTYFVANEWFKIQTERRINLALQIILTLFALEILGLKYWTRATPELRIDDNEIYSFNEKNFTLRFGLGALVYITCYCLQWIISVTFYERYIKNRMQHFVDLCSVANISIFIFAYDYYGYYIHGRSVHGYADTNLETLINDLKKEENNLCAHRGLIPGATNQTFITSLSSSFRDIYQKILDLHNKNDSRFLRRDVLGSLNWQQNFQTHVKIKKFLTAFIDHCFKDLDYVIKDRLLLEKLCDIEIGTNDDQSTFYTDNNNTFDRVIFYGNEWTLGTFEITLFVFAQTLAEDYILACMLTMLISHSLITISRINGKRNLAKKTLIDERFLM